MNFPIDAVRAQFPSLNREIDGQPLLYLDNPAGTQVPQRVIDAVSDYYRTMNANQGGPFATSRANDAMFYSAREIMADMLCAPRPEEIVFGANMTTLNFALSRAIAKTLPDDAEIVVTRMDHDANIAPWLTIAEDNDWTVHWVDFDPEAGTLDMNSLDRAINPKTAIVAAVHASNALGTINPVKQIADAAHTVDALFIMDAVQSAPHVPIDVEEIGCDVLLCSAYKFFGPHIGVMWGRYDLLEALPVYKVRPAKDQTPYRWESGTPSFETIAGTAAAVEYIETLADESIPVEGHTGRRKRLKQAFANVQRYETELAKHLIDGLQAIKGVTIAGVLDDLNQRVATVAFAKDGIAPVTIQEKMAEQQIFLWAGHYYALEVMARLGREEQGMVRVGPVHYNTTAEIDRFLNALEAL